MFQLFKIKEIEVNFMSKSELDAGEGFEPPTLRL